MMNRCRVNLYNWLGQKMLVSGRNDELFWLHRQLNKESQTNSSLKNHLDYLQAVAQIKLGLNIDQLIDCIQKSNYDRSIQFFLLLCQCLIYQGRHDSIAALCRQFIDKETNLRCFLDQSSSNYNNHESNQSIGHEYHIDSDKILEQISRNKALREPKFWCIFASSLEFLRQFKSADQAYKVAVKMLLDKDTSSKNNHLRTDNSSKHTNHKTLEGLNRGYSFGEIHSRYAELLLNVKNDERAALEIMNQSHEDARSIGPRLALIHSITRPPTYSQQLKRAIKTISDAEVSYFTFLNPSAGYNDLAKRCNAESNGYIMSNSDNKYFELYLAKSHLLLNQLTLDLTGNAGLLYNIRYSSSKRTTNEDLPSLLSDVLDKMIDALKRCKPSCWYSAALWNNLGLCYLMKRRFIASLSCLLRAQLIKPLDWRINFNLAISFAHVGLTSRALVHLNMSVRYFPSSDRRNPNQSVGQEQHFIRVIKSYVATCLAELEEVDASRQLHIESQKMVSNSGPVQLLPLLNYLIFLHIQLDSGDPQTIKMRLALLDQLEQYWLQRNQNSPQFNRFLLDVATTVAQEIRTFTKSEPKIYAWTRVDQ